MSAADLRKRLARLEAAKARRVRMRRELTEAELARSVAYVLTSALAGHGGEATRETAIAIAETLSRYQQPPLLTAGGELQEPPVVANESFPAQANRKRPASSRSSPRQEL